MDLKICSLNVRGLGDKLKRREMFNWLRRKNHSIFMPQEVHCSENTMSLWAVEWGYKTLFSCCTSAKGGVAILFNNNFDLQLLRTYLDPNGRFIICDITAEKKCMTIATLYAPNDDDPNFFLNFFDHLNDFQCDEVIIGGDFNLVLDLDMDKKGGLAKTHTESVKILKDFCAQFELLDAWRVLNPDTRRYTWRRKRPEIQCRLDFLLVTESLMCNVKSANISTGYKTDHSLIEIKIALHSNMRGPGFWKLNTSLLTEIDYVNQIRTGFLKGRFIGENIRLVDGVIKHAAAKNIPGLLLFLDFEKAFDTVEWSFIQKTLKHFNFGPSTMNWIRLFYHNTESCILNNGWSSAFFKLGRGVRQGCPLSPYLFILCAEILAETIRKNENIKGITINEQEIKISQYADDTTLILDGSTVSFTTSLRILDLFSEISGLRLNNKKTVALWIGANIGKETNLAPEKDFKWVKDKVRALGVWLSTNPETTIEANYNEKLTKVRNSLSCWELRRLSLLGKITVLKSLIASQLVYILSPLPTNHKVIGEINNIFFNFLWDGKGDKIKRDIMISDYENGGLKMIDIKVFNRALKSGWIKKYLDNENHGKWKLLFDLELRKFGGEEIFRGNLSKEDLSKYIKISDTFTLEILQIWTDIKYEATISSIEQLKAHNLWQNSLIRVGNRPIHYRSWSSKGVTTVGHLMKDENNFLSFSDFTDRYNIETNFLTFQSVLSAVKALRKSNAANFHNGNAIHESITDTFLKTKKPNRLAYKILVSKKQKRPITAQTKWIADCTLETQEIIDWKTVYRTPFLCTKITKIIVFQFKLLHRRLATNSFLTKINLKDNEQCTFCQNDKETLIHLFWTCEISTLFWEGFKQWAINRGELSNNTNLSPYLVLGLKPNKNKSINFYFLIARYFIWICKMRSLSPKIENFSLFLSHYDITKTFS